MKLIKFVHDELGFSDKVQTLVGIRKTAKQTEVRNKIQQAIQEKNDAMQAKLVAKEKLSVKKFGKPSTVRSAKPKIIQKTVKKVIDEETQDQLTYLELELKDVAEF